MGFDFIVYSMQNKTKNMNILLNNPSKSEKKNRLSSFL